MPDKPKRRFYIPTGLIGLVGLSLYTSISVLSRAPVHQIQCAEVDLSKRYVTHASSRILVSGLPLMKTIHISKAGLDDDSTFYKFCLSLYNIVDSIGDAGVVTLQVSPRTTYGDFVRTLDAINLANLDYQLEDSTFFLLQYPVEKFARPVDGPSPIVRYPQAYRSGLFAVLQDSFTQARTCIIDRLKDDFDLITNANWNYQSILGLWFLLLTTIFFKYDVRA